MGSSCSLLFILYLLFLSSETEQSQQQPAMIVPLTHSLSTTTTTQFTSPHHLLKSAAVRSTARHRHYSSRNRRQVSLPLSPGSDYTLTLSLRSQTLSLYMDTGSDLVWAPCSPFECILCEGKSPSNSLPPPLNVSSSSLLTCQSRACSAAHSSPSSSSSSDLCAMANCPLDQIETSDCQKFSCPPFYYAYGDGSLVAKLHRDTLKMATGSGEPVFLPNFTFGCAHSTLGEPVGVAGFGRGLLSLPNQLARVSPQLGNQFSYCLVSHSFDSTRIRQPSPLILGRSNLKQREEDNPKQGRGRVVFTPLLDNPKHPYFYSVGLEAVSVGAVRIPAPTHLSRVDRRGNGGVVVDSGTTNTMLPRGFYNAVVAELNRQVGRVYKRAILAESTTGLRPCYFVESRAGEGVPGFALHFAGNSTVVLPRRNYFYQFLDGGDDVGAGGKKKRVGCLMVMDGGDDADDGPGATLGNYQQQGFEVVYDLEDRRVGFGRRKCDSMWDELNRR